jgi:DNA-binding transcriptional MerR regulator
MAPMKVLTAIVLTSEATRILGVAVPTLRQLERRGEIHPIRTSAGFRLFDREELERVAAARAARSSNGEAA